MVLGALVHAPDGSGAKLAAVAVCHTGSKEEADRELEPLLGFGSPALTAVGPMPYPDANTLLDAGYPKGALTTGSRGSSAVWTTRRSTRSLSSSPRPLRR